MRGTTADHSTQARQIFRYLAEVGESRSKPIRTLDGARHMLWFDELPAGIDSLATTEDSGEPEWLRVDRPQRREPPQPEALLVPWIDEALIRNVDGEQPPGLLPKAVVAEQEHNADGEVRVGDRTVRLENYHLQEKVRTAHARWATSWRGWAAQERAAAPVAALYEKLYRIHEDVAVLGESFELVLGCGLLTWRAEQEPIRRPLVVGRAVLTLDQRTGTLILRPDPESGGLLLEESMLDATQKVRSETRETIRGLLEQAGDLSSPDQREPLHHALGIWVNSAHQAGSYTAAISPKRSSDLSVPAVSFAPVLLLRERTRRTLLDVLHGIARRIDQGAEPTPLLRFIAGDSSEEMADAVPEGPSAFPTRAPEETYFALPSNEEQRTIAERLRERRLVVVQGPPGTGKTHTIANLVTDLLAHGRRVLITSHTARALKVLKEKLPEGVRELCVSRTDDGVAAQQELEGSIRAILERQGNYSSRDYERRIAQNEKRLSSAYSTRARALKELRVIREQETYRHPADIGDYQGTLQQIARRLADERAAHGWLGSAPSPQPTLTSGQVQALRRAAAAFTAEHKALVATVTTVPDIAELPGPAAFERAVSAIRAAEDASAQIRGEGVSARLESDVNRLPVDRQEELSALIDAYEGAWLLADAQIPAWAPAFRDEVLRGNDWELHSRRERTATALTAADTAERALGQALVTGLEKFDLGTALGQATMLRDGLAAGGRLRGLMGLKTRLRKMVGELVDTVRIDGRPPEDEAAAAVVLHRVLLERHLQDVETEWGDGAEPWQPPARRLARLRQDTEALERLTDLAESRAELLACVTTVPMLAAAPWHDRATVTTVRDLLRARATLRSAEDQRALLASAADILRVWADRPGAPVTLLMRGSTAVTDMDHTAWNSICDELSELREALRLKKEHDTAFEAVASVLPQLAQAIESAPADPVWDERLPGLDRAWAWSAWSQRMRELTDPEAERKQRAILAEADGDIRIARERLAADRSWHSCLSRLTDDQAVALASYQQSTRRLGKGTGKYAARYRAQARENLRACQGAVPAWIMPLYQVAETVPTDAPGRFDVVIIDEASQSGPEALLLAWLGAKIVVVGDDKQVSPPNVGMDRDRLFELQSRMLGGLPPVRRSLFDPDASFFNIASGLAGGTGRLMLREHFRCMPEIIGFSNGLFYDSELQPLRQYGTDRLPPLRTVHVPDGYIEGTGQKQVNRVEAEQLVDQLVRCCANPRYEGRTMGVVTLLGAAQKNVIEDLLAERLPFTERQARRLRVGNAEDFQGDERDVMFLSLVVSLATATGDNRPGHFVSEMHQQRINVAASRARDQVWVFHSVTVTELGENDLRRQYLDYLTRPAEEQDGLGLDDVSPDERHKAFDSLFEQRVFLALRQRGYRVRPQYPAGRYRIDLVVEGGTRRLAVECDGDAFHNEENAEADASRQQELERVGWTFVRIRGSRFFLDPQAALKPLWAALERLGIERYSTTQRNEREAALVAAPAGTKHSRPPEQRTPAAPTRDAEGRTALKDTPSRPAAVTSGRTTAPPPIPPAVPAGRQKAAPRAAGTRTRPTAPASARDRAASEPAERTQVAIARAGDPKIPIDRLSLDAYGRVQDELDRLQRTLAQPTPQIVAVDSSSRSAQLQADHKRRARLEGRRDYLQRLLAEVLPDPRCGGGHIVTPGCLVGIEYDDEAGVTVYEIAAVKPVTDDHEWLTPDSALGLALIWREVGDEVSYQTESGARLTVTIRFVNG